MSVRLNLDYSPEHQGWVLYVTRLDEIAQTVEILLDHGWQRFDPGEGVPPTAVVHEGLMQVARNLAAGGIVPEQVSGADAHLADLRKIAFHALGIDVEDN